MRSLRAVCRYAVVFFVLCLSFVFPAYADSTPAPSTTDQAAISQNKKTSIYIGTVVDAAELKEYSKDEGANTQLLTLELYDKSKSSTLRIDTSLVFPTYQFKRPLKIGDKVLIETGGELSGTSSVSIISMYRQNNLLVWALILVGLFILVAGFRTNLKYFQIFIMTVISGLVVLFFYHRNTYLTFGVLFLWQLLATIWFAFRVFQKRTPAIVLTISVIGNQLLALALVFIMKNINIFDIGFFELFFPSHYDAREVMMYTFALLVLYPIAVVFSEQIISESIKKKREENDIVKINLIRYVSRSSLKGLNNLFLTLFGLFFSICVGVVAISSREQTTFAVVNSSALSQILSVGFLLLFDLLIFIPLVSFLSGMWLGRMESHHLVTDKNLRQLEL